MKNRFNSIFAETVKKPLNFIMGILASIIANDLWGRYTSNDDTLYVKMIRILMILIVYVLIISLVKYISEINKENIELKSNTLEFMKKFVVSNDNIDAIQIYDYSMFSEQGKVMIYLGFDKQYIKEKKRVSLNAITNYYNIDLDIFNKFHNILNLYNNYDGNGEDLLRKIYDLMDIILNNETSEHIRIYKIIYNMASEINEEIESQLNNSTVIENAVLEYAIEGDNYNDNLRTGIMGAILMADGYIYTYQKEKQSKVERKYYSFCDSINNNDKKIITFILDTNLSLNNDIDSLLEEILDNYEDYKQQFSV